MLEYASMRLILRCMSATTFPSVMVSTARIHRIHVQSTARAPRVCRNTRVKAANAAAFTPTAISAVTDVGAPS